MTRYLLFTTISIVLFSNQIIAQNQGCDHNYIVNGDFENGSFGFSTQYQYLTPGTNFQNCKEYTVAQHPAFVRPKIWITDYQNTSNATPGNCLVLDLPCEKSFEASTYFTAWQQSVTIPSREYNYLFSLDYSNSNVGSHNRAKFYVYVDGELQKTTIVENKHQYQNTGRWEHLSFVFTPQLDQNNSPIDIRIVVVPSAAQLEGSDVAIDNIQLKVVPNAEFAHLPNNSPSPDCHSVPYIFIPTNTSGDHYWTYGDGSPVDQREIGYHKYENAGSYVVNHRVALPGTTCEVEEQISIDLLTPCTYDICNSANFECNLELVNGGDFEGPYSFNSDLSPNANQSCDDVGYYQVLPFSAISSLPFTDQENSTWNIGSVVDANGSNVMIVNPPCTNTGTVIWSKSYNLDLLSKYRFSARAGNLATDTDNLPYINLRVLNSLGAIIGTSEPMPLSRNPSDGSIEWVELCLDVNTPQQGSYTFEVYLNNSSSGAIDADLALDLISIKGLSVNDPSFVAHRPLDCLDAPTYFVPNTTGGGVHSYDYDYPAGTHQRALDPVPTTSNGQNQNTVSTTGFGNTNYREADDYIVRHTLDGCPWEIVVPISSNVCTEPGTCTANNLCSNLLINGEFEGNTNFNTDLIQHNGSGALNCSGNYLFTDDASQFSDANPNSSWSLQGRLNSGNFMLVDPPCISSTTPVLVWQQTIASQPTKLYRFKGFASPLGSTEQPYLIFRINDGEFQIGKQLQWNAPSGNWEEFCFEFAASSSQTKIEILVASLSDEGVSMDFGLDGLEFGLIGNADFTIYQSTTCTDVPVLFKADEQTTVGTHYFDYDFQPNLTRTNPPNPTNSNSQAGVSTSGVGYAYFNESGTYTIKHEVNGCVTTQNMEVNSSNCVSANCSANSICSEQFNEGDFENGNNTWFQSNLQAYTPSSIECDGYFNVTNTSVGLNNGDPNWSLSSGHNNSPKFLLINSKCDDQTGEVIWKKNVQVQDGNTYRFEGFAAPLGSNDNPILTFKVDGNEVISAFGVTENPGTDGWSKFCFEFTPPPGVNTALIEISLVPSNEDAVSMNLALDDLSWGITSSQVNASFISNLPDGDSNACIFKNIEFQANDQNVVLNESNYSFDWKIEYLEPAPLTADYVQTTVGRTLNYQFEEEGTYSITLKVTENSSGCSNTQTDNTFELDVCCDIAPTHNVSPQDPVDCQYEFNGITQASTRMSQSISGSNSNGLNQFFWTVYDDNGNFMFNANNDYFIESMPGQGNYTYDYTVSGYYGDDPNYNTCSTTVTGTINIDETGCAPQIAACTFSVGMKLKKEEQVLLPNGHEADSLSDQFEYQLVELPGGTLLTDANSPNHASNRTISLIFPTRHDNNPVSTTEINFVHFKEFPIASGNYTNPQFGYLDMIVQDPNGNQCRVQECFRFNLNSRDGNENVTVQSCN